MDTNKLDTAADVRRRRYTDEFMNKAMLDF
jgi:hypothetical protein